MRKLYNLINKSEDVLLDKMIAYAKKHNYTMYNATLREAWRATVIGLSNAIKSALKLSSEPPEMDVHHDFSNDPIIVFAIEEAVRHRRRGVNLKMFMGDLKYNRQCYLDLIAEADFKPEYLKWSNLYITRVFDRMEIGIMSEWVESPKEDIVTELQATNRMLTNEKNSYITIFESLPTPVIYLDNDYNIKNMNLAASHLFGYSDISGAFYYRTDRSIRVLDFVNDELDKFAAANISEMIFEKTFYVKGKIRHYEVKLAKMLDSTEKFSGVILTMNDISDRKRVEDSRFLSSQKEWEDTFNTISDMITVHDTEGNITRANTAARDFLRIPVTQKFPVRCVDVFPHDFNACIEKNCRETCKPTSTETFDSFSGRYLEINIIPKLNNVDVVTGIILIIRDITDKKMLKDQLFESQKMEAIGHLAGGIAHDFNNLLTAVKGAGYLIHKRVSPDDPVSPLANQILEETEKASNLVQGLLAYSRKQIIAPAYIDINVVIASVERILSRLISEDIKIVVELAKTPLVIMADSLQLQQVLMNLATNAGHAMPNGGVLTISTDSIVLDKSTSKSPVIEHSGAFVELTVKDTGTGILEGDIPHIFDPYFTTKEIGKGTGLGLAIVYGIIKQHGGYVTVESTPGKGTYFRLYFPLVNEHLKQVRATGDSKIVVGSGTVLLAEDDDSVRSTLQEILKNAGYCVIAATDGIEAVELFEANQAEISLVVLDVIMPRMDGKRAYDAIRNLSPGIPILFTSGYSSDVISKKGMLDKDIRLISKSASTEAFLMRIKETMES